MTQPAIPPEPHPDDCLCPRCDPDDVKLRAALARTKKPRADGATERMDRCG